MQARAMVFLATSVLVVACASDTPTGAPPSGPMTGVRLINAFDSNVDVLVDGVVLRSGLASGALADFEVASGARSVQVRPTSGATSTLPVTVTAGHLYGLAATRLGGGALSLESLEDSNAVVPAGATKLRVLHLAPHAGEVQVWRTQPDFQTPIRWAFPFTYNSAKVYYQSTPGTWEVRVWTDVVTYPPGDSRGWSAAALDTAKVTLSGGGKKTVVILDGANGKVKLQVID